MEPSSTPAKPRLYYGWALVGAGFLIYGFGLSPGYYSWGFYAKNLEEELGFSRAQIGGVFGSYALCYSLFGWLSAAAMRWFGLRVTITAGSLIAAFGFFGVSRAESVWDFYLYYSLIAGAGIGLSTQVPIQTLASQWFERYRARAMSIMIASGGLIGFLVPYINAMTLEGGGWRFGWRLIAATSIGVAVVAAIFVRDSPESMGLLPDGRTGDDEAEDELSSGDEQAETSSIENDATGAPPAPIWTAAQAIRTPQFALITWAALTCSAPWTAFSTHGRIHLESVGLSTALVASLFALRIFTSTGGRLAASLGDFISPRRLLGVALFVEAAGLAGLVFTRSEGPGYFFSIIFGFGFGAALLSVQIVFASFFGRAAFPGTQGMSRMLNGAVRFLSPWLAGALADWSGGYALPFLLIAGIALSGSAVAFVCPPPRHPEQRV